MCYGCWTEEGSPQIDTPAVRAAAASVAAVYEHSCVGGNLHIVLDDWNLEDDNLKFCDAQIARGGHPEDPNHSKWYTQQKLDNPDTPEQLAAERKCHDLFAALSIKERASALALNDGFWGLRGAEKETPSHD